MTATSKTMTACGPSAYLHARQHAHQCSKDAGHVDLVIRIRKLISTLHVVFAQGALAQAIADNPELAALHPELVTKANKVRRSVNTSNHAEHTGGLRPDQLPSHRSEPWMRRSSATVRLVRRSSARQSCTSPNASGSTQRARPVHFTSCAVHNRIWTSPSLRAKPVTYLCTELHSPQCRLKCWTAALSAHIAYHRAAPLQERDLS